MRTQQRPAARAQQNGLRKAKRGLQYMQPNEIEHESLMEEAIALVRAQRGPKSYDRVLSLSRYSGLKKETLRKRCSGRGSRAAGYDRLRAIEMVRENVFADWLKVLGYQGTPLSRRAARARMKLIFGVWLSKKWMLGFERRHPDIIWRKPRPLDPRRAQAMNETNMKIHFDELHDAEQGVAPENIYNLDENGTQEGGGRKNLTAQFAFDVEDTNRVRQRSDSLKTVTIIDCVCADGSAMVPGFVFTGQDGTWPTEWFWEPQSADGDSRSLPVLRKHLL
jgi:hypothetical protein